MAHRPYVGITGFTDRAEVEKLLSQTPEKPSRSVMVGVLASGKTLRGRPDDRYPNRYPKVEDIAKIFVPHQNAVNLVHYATDQKETLGFQLIVLISLCGSSLQGIQLNVPWPLHRHIEGFRKKYPKLRLVLQVGGGALKEIGDSPTRLIGKIAEYDGLLDDVLIDPSGGKGAPLVPRVAMEYVEALAGCFPKLGVGIAGGLSAESLPLIRPIVKRFPKVSIDAEGRLRNEEDKLDLEKTSQYLTSALGIFGEFSGTST